MSGVYTDEQLLDVIRHHAFESLLFAVALSDGCPLKQGLTQKFNDILHGVDELKRLTMEANVKDLQERGVGTEDM